MLKKSIVVGMTAAFMIATAIPAEAGKKSKRNAVIGIFAAIGTAAAIAAAADAAKRRQHSNEYHYYHGASERDNAVAACLHKAHRRNLREGGDGIEFVRISRNKKKKRHFIIGIHVDRFGPWGVDRQYAKCKVRRDHVYSFSWH